MIEKISVTQSQANKLKEYLEVCRKAGKNPLDVFASSGCELNDYYESLNSLSIEDMARAILIGYEIEPVYKVGELVTITAPNSKFGKVYEIIEEQDIGVYLLKMESINTMLWHIEEFRHATPEEIKAEKERRLWKSIGREIGEFRKGDTFVSTRGNVWKILNNINSEYAKGNLKGFYPAESFISFDT